jgi:hypothetical protein
VFRRVLGGGWARHLHALGDIVGPVRYASLCGHVPLIGLGRVVVFIMFSESDGGTED